jgi:hypothetical protein
MLKDASNNTVSFLAPVNIYGGNVYVETPYAWTTSASSTLRASSNIYINANIDITGANAGLNILYGGTDGTTAPTSTNFYQLSLENRTRIKMVGASPALKIGNKVYTVYTTAAQLQAMGSTSSTYVALGDYLDVSGTTYTSSFYTSQFAGSFDGLGNIIDGLTIRSASVGSVGLFSSLNGANISNIGLSNIDIKSRANSAVDNTSNFEYIGGVAGLVTGASVSDVTNISGVWVTGAISKQSGTSTFAFFAGGLVGQHIAGTLNIDRTYSTANVSTQGASSTSTSVAVGGLVGNVGPRINNTNPGGGVGSGSAINMCWSTISGRSLSRQRMR